MSDAKGDGWCGVVGVDDSNRGGIAEGGTCCVVTFFVLCDFVFPVDPGARDLLGVLEADAARPAKLGTCCWKTEGVTCPLPCPLPPPPLGVLCPLVTLPTLAWPDEDDSELDGGRGVDEPAREAKDNLSLMGPILPWPSPAMAVVRRGIKRSREVVGPK